MASARRAGFALLVYAAPEHAADPVKVGVSLSLTGGVASNGKQILMALELWRDDVNAKGGLLRRPVEIVYYDDQSRQPNLYSRAPPMILCPPV
jgi:branched-chain amino acid transport system substrate-binding protein